MNLHSGPAGREYPAIDMINEGLTHEYRSRFQDVDDLLTKVLDALSESSGGHMSGAWVFRGTRMPVAAVFENLEDGITIDELLELYDGLTREQVQAVLEFAAQSLQA